MYNEKITLFNAYTEKYTDLKRNDNINIGRPQENEIEVLSKDSFILVSVDITGVLIWHGHIVCV